jgi:ribonuclease D
MQPPSMPTPEEIALLEPFDRIGLERIALVSNGEDAERAAEALVLVPVWGFDTESRPTFQAGQASEGPHIVQLATREAVFIFQLHDPHCRQVTGELLARPGIVKAGFGLHDDTRRITSKLGVQPQGVLDLDTVFRQRGYRRQMGTKAAVAVLFGRRYLKSKRAATSNWAQRQLTPQQLLYAANDAWAALRVYEALGLPPDGAALAAEP